MGGGSAIRRLLGESDDSSGGATTGAGSGGVPDATGTGGGLSILVVATGVDMADRKGDAVHLRNLVEQWGRDHDVHLVSATDPGDCPDGVRLAVDVTAAGLVAPFLRAVVGSLRFRRRFEYDFIYHRHDLFGSGIPSGAFDGPPLVLEVNGSAIREHRLRGTISTRTARLLDWYERRVVSFADRIVCVSPRLADEFASRGVQPDKLSVVGNGHDPSRFAPVPDARTRLGLDADKRYVGFVGSLSRWHGLDVILAAFDDVVVAYPDTDLLVVGDGPRRQALTEKAASAGLADHVEFVGSVPHDRVPAYMSAFDVGIALKHPAIPGSPLKLFEYLACGTPVLATADDDFAFLADVEARCLVEYGDPESVSEGIVSLLSADPDRLQRTARELSKEHTWERVAEDVLAVAVAR